MMILRSFCCGLVGLSTLSLQAEAQVQFADPVMVTTAVFDAARTGDDTALATLCDPQNENDGDTRRICEMNAAAHDWREFVTIFEKGRVSGPAVIDQNTAEVPFLFGPDGMQPETMNLIRRGENWYLLSF